MSATCRAGACRICIRLSGIPMGTAVVFCMLLFAASARNESAAGEGENPILKVSQPHVVSPLPKDKLPRPLLPDNPEWVELYWEAWEILWNKIHSGTAANGFVERYLDEGFNEQIYQWDTCFMALFALYGRPLFPAMESLENFYLKQRDNGYIQRVYHETTGAEVAEPTPDEPLVNPPLFAWVEWSYAEQTGDTSRVRAVLPKLIRYFDWVKTNCRAKEGKGLYYNTPLGSGMDNTPRGEIGKGGWIDMSAQQALAAQCIAKLAHAIGDGETASRFEVEASEIVLLIDSLCWDEERAAYFDFLPEGKPGPVRHLGSYWTLQVMSDSTRLDKMEEPLFDENFFSRPHRLPTLSYSDSLYNPRGNYWRGGVWAPTNYMTVNGLERLGKHEAAIEIATNHLNNLAYVLKHFRPDEDSIAFAERSADGYATLWECYAPEGPRPATRWDDQFYSRQDFVGWTGLGPIASLLETILGINSNGLSNEIEWSITRGDLHGVEHYQFGTQRVDLLFNPLRSPPQVIAGCEEPFTLVVLRGGKRFEFAVPFGGTHSFELVADE